MTVSREKLYEQVWAEPMTSVAKQYEVSSNYLARICERVGVPIPPRGYWQKVNVGRAPPKPPLPPPEPGTEIEWRREYWARAERAPYAPRFPLPDAVRRRRIPVPDTHPLLIGTRELFEITRPSRTFLAPLFLCPCERKLPDIVVTKEALPRAMETANALYRHLESHAYPVTLAARGMFWRQEPERSGGKNPERLREEWSPYTPTVVRVRMVAFGLTLFETTKDIETVSVNGKSIPVDALPHYRRRIYGAPTTSTVPSGLLALAAYSPYPDTSWYKEWTEPSAGKLHRVIDTLRRELEISAPDVARLVAEADARAEAEKLRRLEERRRWEEEERERKRREEERRRQQAAKESRDQLLAIVDAWAVANRVEDFFQDASSRLPNEADQDARGCLASRLEAARQMLGGADALKHFKSWKTPEEQLARCSMSDGAS